MKNKAFNLLIVLALILGAISIFLIQKFVKIERAKSGNNTVAGVAVVKETGKVLVASSDIPPGKNFGPLSFQVVELPKDLVPPTALTLGSELDGKLSSVFIPKGDMILSSKAVTPSQLPRASYMIEPGRRIISMPVDGIGTSGFVIKLGDYVDLVGMFSPDKEALARGQELYGGMIAVTFMQRVRVVDIYKGEVDSAGGGAPTQATGPSNQGKRLGEGTIATFDVTAREAEVIMGALRSSQGVSLILRRFDDDEIRVITNPLHNKIIDGLNQVVEKKAEVAPVQAPTPAPSRRKVL